MAKLNGGDRKQMMSQRQLVFSVTFGHSTFYFIMALTQTTFTATEIVS
jgi:hypothetical protein